MRRPILQTAVALLLVSAGCSMFGSDAVRQPEALDHLDGARERLDAVTSYRYDVTISATGGDERITGHGLGAVNATTRRQVVNLSIDGRRSMSYLDNRTAFTECRGPAGDGFWGRDNSSTASNWTALTPAGRQLELLSTGDLYHNGTETIGGWTVVHLSGRPTPASLRESRDGTGVPVVGGPNVDSVTLDLWLDAETERPVRSELQVVVSRDGETATATVTTEYRDYGEPVRISIPDGVRADALRNGCPGS
jgi:hypothetical protein